MIRLRLVRREMKAGHEIYYGNILVLRLDEWKPEGVFSLREPEWELFRDMLEGQGVVVEYGTVQADY